MGLAKIFKNMKPEERSRWANNRKAQLEKELKFITKITRKLSEDKKFTPMEEDLIDTILEKDGGNK